jgi:uncharacterized integral membrane protein (TIGR00698 family)
MSKTEADYSWAQYLDYMEGVPMVVQLHPTMREERHAWLGWGVLIVGILTALAIWLSELQVWPFTLKAGKHPIEPVMLAIIAGMLVSNLWTLPNSCSPGIKFSIKKLLPLGIILLGARLNFFDIVRVGLMGILLSVIEIIVALYLLLYLTRRMNLPPKLGTLLGVGTAICGGTAIIATAPVIEAEEKDVVFSVATVTLLGLLAMFTMPLVGSFLHLSSKAFGVWVGLAIHQTPQVVASGFAYSPEAGETATITKLARVCLLAPVVFVLGVIHVRDKYRRGDTTVGRKINYLGMFPKFVLGFLGMALLRTLGLIPDLTIHLTQAVLLGRFDYSVNLANFAQEISKVCIIASMVGVGLETRFSAMRQTGLRPFLAGLFGATVIAVMVLGAVTFLRL